MNSEVQESIVVIRTIHKHLAEENCIHTIREIMQEALENRESGQHSQTPPTGKTQSSQGVNQNDYDRSIR